MQSERFKWQNISPEWKYNVKTVQFPRKFSFPRESYNNFNKQCFQSALLCFLAQARALILLAECTVHGRTRAELRAMLLSWKTWPPWTAVSRIHNFLIWKFFKQKFYELIIPIYSPTLTMKTHKAINLPFVLCGCEMYSLTLREHKLHVSENWCSGKYMDMKMMK